MISIIIPAYNEEEHIKNTICRLKSDDYKDKEIIVVTNGCKDRTFEIAKANADQAIDFKDPIGVSAARNEGAKIAKGDIFVFVDADSYLSKGSLKNIALAVKGNIMGSCLGRADNKDIRAKIFFLWKNLTHILRIYRGVIDGVFFCHKEVFFKNNGFDTKRKIAEFEDFIKRASSFGAEYKLLTNCYAITSMRRYEGKGYIKALFFWPYWKILSLFGKGKKLEKEYFEKDV